MFRVFFILGLVAGTSAAAGVTVTTWFFMSGSPRPLAPEWASALFFGIVGMTLLATLLLYLATRLTVGIARFLGRTRS